MNLLMFNLATDADDSILGFTTHWIRALAKHADFIHVITMRAGRVEVPKNVEVYSIGKEKGYSEPRRAGVFYWQLLRILRDKQIDACFSHMAPIFTVLAAPVLKTKGIPIVTWYAHRQVTITLKLAHLLSDRMVSVNESSYPYSHNKLVALGHGITTEIFAPTPNGTKEDNPPLLLSVARLSPIKDLLTFVYAVHQLQEKGFEVQAAMVGEVPERDRLYAESLRNEVRRLGIDGIVQFVGSMPQNQVVNWYRRCFVHINCAPPDHSLDKAALEAMACGKPSLSSTLGFRQTMGEEAHRLLFQHRNADDLARKLMTLLELAPSERLRIEGYLRERVVQMHSLRRFAERLVGLLRGLEKVARSGKSMGQGV